MKFRPGESVYLAARYSRRLELCGYRDLMQKALGVVVTSRWLNGMHQLDDQGVPIGDDGERRFETYDDPTVNALRVKFAQDDFSDVLAADTVIHFTEIPRTTNNRGGRHVEMGVGLGAEKRVVVVGPHENVFTWLPEVHYYENWTEFWTETVSAWIASGYS